MFVSVSLLLFRSVISDELLLAPLVILSVGSSFLTLGIILFPLGGHHSANLVLSLPLSSYSLLSLQLDLLSCLVSGRSWCHLRVTVNYGLHVKLPSTDQARPVVNLRVFLFA